MDVRPRVWLDVDLGAIRENFKILARQISPCRLTAVVKADAYGVGMAQVAPVTVESGADLLTVATLEEALEAKRFGVPVQILGQLDASEIPGAVAADIVIPVTGEKFASEVAACAARQHKAAVCALAVDSGMGRLGMPVASAFPGIIRIANLKELRLRGIFSHFSCASAPGRAYTALQLERFTALVRELAGAGITFEDVHIAASGGIAYVPEAHKVPFTRCRTGIDLYGLGDGAEKLKPAVSLKARLVAIRKLAAGSGIGYEKMHTLAEDTLVGTVAAGYADGIPLALSNRGYVLVNGTLCPVLGRVSMDYTTIALRDAAAKEGDEVVFFGQSGDRTLAVEAMAQLKGTHAYDILCSLGPRVKRCYLR